jgi:type I restriction enzyme, S subunit
MARKTIYPPSVQPGLPNLPKLPPDWELILFSEVVKVVQHPVKLDDNQEYRLVNAKRNRGGIVLRGQLLGRDILTKTQFYIHAGDFLISRRQIIHGACGVVPKDLDRSVVSNEYLSLVCRQNLLSEYLDYFSHSIYFQQTCFHSSIGVDVEKMVFKLEDWLKYKMPLPPIAQQKKIAEILGTWDEAIGAIEKLIAAKQKLKRALMQSLLTGKLRSSQFTDNHFWSEGKFYDAAEVIMGQSPDGSTYNREGIGVPLLNGPTEFSQRYPVRIQWTSKCTKKCYREDILLCVRGSSTGRINIADDVYCIGRGIAAIRAKSGKSINSYLEHQLIYGVQKILSLTAGSTFPNIDKKSIEKIPIALPSLEEQNYISEILSGVDKENYLLQEQVEKLNIQKRGLMQKLLTGQWRVNTEE